MSIDQTAQYLYATYRIFWEKASNKTILKEIKGINRNFLKKLRTFSWERALQSKDKKEKLSICEAVPSFMIEHLLPVMNLEFLEANLRIMNSLTESSEVTARINTLLKEDDNNILEVIIKSELEKLNVFFKKDTLYGIFKIYYPALAIG